MRKAKDLYRAWLTVLLALWLGSCTLAPKNVDQSSVSIQEIKDSFKVERTGRIQFQGVVTVEDPTFGFFIVQDETAGIRVQPRHFIEKSLRGHLVEIAGSLPTESATYTIADAIVEDLGVAAMPEARSIEAHDLKTDTFDEQLVRLEGVARVGRVDATGQLVIPSAGRFARSSGPHHE
jgi:hypothetical protein